EEKGISREELTEITGGRSVPQIVIDDKAIGGYDNLVALDQEGKL
ncbi:MAG: glutaredoxin 3, partial [Candidatus Marinimicrobia bacterium]|nr:glutaredoxin 3 [Candidatus Neomarinimicrobiota bacterium]MBT6470981.1 glutaredoxin 3 [Candidatus Neomarinimicrobiota bacterium]MBT6936858.1 glutaredoxin 3 [Candidatus Neomarinimicrobiota bacterium]